MKYITIFFLFFLMSATIRAQDADLPGRNISLVIRDKKGRPIERIIVRSLNNTNAGMTNRKGLFVFTDMTDNDRISMFLPKYGETIISVTGMDSIVVMLRSSRRYSYVSNTGQEVIINRPNKTEPSTVLDVQTLLQRNAYKSLLDLLQGQVPGLNITPSSGRGGATSTSIRGQSSFLSNSEPLVVVDGVPMDISLGDIDAIVNVYDVKTIEIQKGGSSEWGVRSANGVILINTR